MAPVVILNVRWCLKDYLFMCAVLSKGDIVNRSARRQKQGEWSAITVMEIEKRRIGWSPEHKKSVYIDESTDPELIITLKRLREADVVVAYDQLRDKTLFIELKEPEREQFDGVYSQYVEVGGQIIYTQKKKGRKTLTLFMLDEGYKKMSEMDVPERKSIFFEYCRG